MREDINCPKNGIILFYFTSVIPSLSGVLCRNFLNIYNIYGCPKKGGLLILTHSVGSVLYFIFSGGTLLVSEGTLPSLA